MAIALSQPRRFSIFGWIRLTMRLTAMLVLLLACVPLFYLARPITRHNPVPRLFLAGIGTIAGMRLRTARPRRQEDVGVGGLAGPVEADAGCQ